MYESHCKSSGFLIFEILQSEDRVREAFFISIFMKEKKQKVMSIVELQLEIINKVNGIADQNILEEINRLIDKESFLLEKYQLTDEEKTALEDGLRDVATGDLHTSDSAQKIIQEWLKK
jgi:hypothetical protein